jgi:hypothetical protein
MAAALDRRSCMKWLIVGFVVALLLSHAGSRLIGHQHIAFAAPLDVEAVTSPHTTGTAIVDHDRPLASNSGRLADNVRVLTSTPLAALPEPDALALIAIGFTALGLVAWHWKRRK